MWDIKQCCERSKQKIFVFIPSLVTFWGYISRKWCKNSLFFTFCIYFRGHLGPRRFLETHGDPWPPLRHAPASGRGNIVPPDGWAILMGSRYTSAYTAQFSSRMREISWIQFSGSRPPVFRTSKRLYLESKRRKRNTPQQTESTVCLSIVISRDTCTAGASRVYCTISGGRWSVGRSLEGSRCRTVLPWRSACHALLFVSTTGNRLNCPALAQGP